MRGAIRETDPVLLYCSTLPFHEPFEDVLAELATQHGFMVNAILPERVAVPRAYKALGYAVAPTRKVPGVTFLPVPLRDPEDPWAGFAASALDVAVSRCGSVGTVWAQEEPLSGTTRQLLAHFARRPRVTFACAAVENVWHSPPRGLRGALWRARLRRVDVVLGASSSALRAADRFLPARAKRELVFLPSRDFNAIPRAELNLPREDGDVWVGFVGRISAEKGWRHLVDALTRLPARFRLAIAGTGPEEEAFQADAGARLKGRAFFAGVLGATALAAFYKQIDILAVPSVSTARWTEQFGAVVAEGLSAGLLVVGSSSGAIPEVLGDAGRIYPEADAAALAAAIDELTTVQVPEGWGARARERYEKLFGIPAYAARVSVALRHADRDHPARRRAG